MKKILLFATLLLLQFGNAQNAGDKDTSFNFQDLTSTVSDANNSTIQLVKLQADGKILVALEVSRNSVPVTVSKIIRYNSNGTIDTSFNIANVLFYIYDMAIQTDGKILIAGNFYDLNNTTIGYVARLNNNGTTDTTFNNGGNTANSIVRCFALQSDGKIIIAGSFTSYNGVAVNKCIRLNVNGSIDTSFNAGIVPTAIFSIVVTNTNKIILGGEFTTFNGVNVNRLVQLNTNGTLDTGFISNIGSGFNAIVTSLFLQLDGKILVSGSFTIFDGYSVNRILRLLPSGLLDTNFNNLPIANNQVNSINIDADGKILIGGIFTSANGTSGNRFARLDSNGYLDNTLNIGSGFDNSVRSIAIQNDGRIIACGAFNNYKSTATKSIVKLRVNNLPVTNVTTIAACGSYNWSINTQTYTTSGTYSVVNGNVTETLNLTINTIPTITGNATQSIPSTGTIGDIVVSPSNVVWYSTQADALSASNSLQNSIPITFSNVYYAVANNGTCKSTPFMVNINTLANENFELIDLKYFPNPTSNILNISYSEMITEILVSNVLGQKLIVEKNNKNDYNLDLSSLPNATYFVKIKSKEKIKTIKILKQ
jgi:uncharacterized delta-60 repeat protein